MAYFHKDQQWEEDQAEHRRYSQKTDDTDTVLTVEGRKLHINKTIMIVSSPVFKAMFEESRPSEIPIVSFPVFRARFEEEESRPSEIPLPGKKFTEVKWLLDYLYPGVYFQLTYEKAVKLLPLADEYGISSLSKECMDVLIKQEQPELNIVALAEKYGNLKHLVAAIELCVAQIPAHTISMQRDNSNINKDHIIEIYEKKIQRVKQQMYEGRNAGWL